VTRIIKVGQFVILALSSWACGARVSQSSGSGNEASGDSGTAKGDVAVFTKPDSGHDPCLGMTCGSFCVCNSYEGCTKEYCPDGVNPYCPDISCQGGCPPQFCDENLICTQVRPACAGNRPAAGEKCGPSNGAFLCIKGLQCCSRCVSGDASVPGCEYTCEPPCSPADYQPGLCQDGCLHDSQQ
jgi:hypothetical protein